MSQQVELAELHTEEAISERIAVAKRHSYLGDFMIGVVRGRVTERNAWLAGAETLMLGGIAAAVAYAVGALLQGTFV